MKICDRVVNGVRLGDVPAGPIAEITDLALQVNAEGSVLLENDGMLPLKKGDKVSVFGRMQDLYHKSGTGSGGSVNVPYKTNILTCLKEQEEIEVNEELAELYARWNEENPIDPGNGWTAPWSQVEMPLSEGVVSRAASVSNKAIVVLARTAGEDKDNSDEKGGLRLSDGEYEMLRSVRAHFAEVCVLLNVGNVMDMSWVKELAINAVLYVWQGGQDGARAVSELLCGKRYPSGKLADTIAAAMSDYPGYDDFAASNEMIYHEDVFVGYRYFETFAKDRVLYPFGYGKGYTEFALTIADVTVTKDAITLDVTVKNTGDYAGKEVVQVYYEAVGQNAPLRQLVTFAKTEELAKGAETSLKLNFAIYEMASYVEKDSQYVLESGDYKIYVGSDVRSAVCVYTYHNPERIVTEQCACQFVPNQTFERLVNRNGEKAYEAVYIGTRAEQVPVKELAYTGDRGIKLSDVYYGKARVEDFVAQLSDYDMACISQGEGMNSPKVRPGTGGTIGGVTKALQDFGIPAVCLSDGPSGIRMDNGDLATNLPGAVMLACTWNPEIVKQIYTYEGMEVYARKIDVLLGPGINIHRNPLCGRNFEYLSEDPHLAGIMGGAICEGLDDGGVTGTIKHFAANHRELNRRGVSSVVSERALREIYLKPFEMIVKAGRVRTLMTAYNLINGVHCSRDYGLATGVLREEWGYKGMVMTDWWPKTVVYENGEMGDIRYPVIASQNDTFMVNKDAETTAKSVMEALEQGLITRAQLQRNTMNICRFVITTPTFERYLDGEVYGGSVDVSGMEVHETFAPVKPETVYAMELKAPTQCAFRMKYRSPEPEITQISVRVYVNGQSAGVFVVNGTEGMAAEDTIGVYVMPGVKEISFRFVEETIMLSGVEVLY